MNPLYISDRSNRFLCHCIFSKYKMNSLYMLSGSNRSRYGAMHILYNIYIYIYKFNILNMLILTMILYIFSKY